MASTNSAHFQLGSAKDLLSWFAYTPKVGAMRKHPSPAVLKDAIEHAVNQTLLRDLFYGAWAVVHTNGSRYHWNDDDEFSIKITSPDPAHDVSPYETTLPAFLQTIGKGYAIYNSDTVKNAIKKQRSVLVEKYNAAYEKKGWKRRFKKKDFTCSFLPPFGLSMIRTDSIQLLHYPPDETVTYMDYLYSPTNRRWENLLGYAGYPGANNTLAETIVDIAPIAASGGSRGGDLIAPVLEDFEPYAMKMLKTLLRTSDGGTTTQPVVAYGGPVRAWLLRNFQQEIVDQGVLVSKDEKGNTLGPRVNQVLLLPIVDSGAKTPVICANHPIRFNYYDSDYGKAEKKHDVAAERKADSDALVILAEDLIASCWQAEMAQTWTQDPDPKAVRDKYADKWGDPHSAGFEQIFDIFKEQIAEFSLSDMPEIDTDAWMEQLKGSIEQPA